MSTGVDSLTPNIKQILDNPLPAPPPISTSSTGNGDNSTATAAAATADATTPLQVPDLSDMTTFSGNAFTNPVYLSAVMVGLIIIVTLVVYLGGIGGAKESTSSSILGTTMSSSGESTDNGGNTTLTIIFVIIILLLVLYVIQYILYYYFNIDISSTVTNFLNPSKKPEIDVVINQNVSKPVPAPAQINTDEVFNIADNAYTYDDAKMVCAAYDAKLATYSQVESAYNNGGEWCNYGWSADQLALFPTQQLTYSELQKTDDHKHDCGRPGVNGGYIANPNVRFGVNCYGKKPKMTQADEDLMNSVAPYPQNQQDAQIQQTVNQWKGNLDDILVSSFNRNKWSQ